MSEEIQADTGSQEASPAISFNEMLSEDIRSDPSVVKFTDANAMAKSYISLSNMIGNDKVVIPRDSATPDEWRAVYNKLGAPDNADAYQFEGLDDGAATALRQQAYDAGLTQAQANKMVEFYNGQMSGFTDDFNSTAEQSVSENKAALEQEWGKAFEQNVNIAARTAKYLLGSTDMFDEIQLADGSYLGDSPEIVKLFHKLGQEFGEDKIIGETTELVMTPDQADRKIAELMAPGTPYRDRDHPEHDHYVEEVTKLFEQKVG